MAVMLPEKVCRFNKPLANCITNRARGYRLLNELCRLAMRRIEERQILDWPTWGFCMAATLYAVEPGRKQLPQRHKGALLQGISYASWPECEARQILTVGPLALFQSMQAVPPQILDDINRSIERARLSPFRGFLKGDTIARFLNVTHDEVDALELRLINAVDFTSADRKRLRKEKSAKRSEARRREHGAVPRVEYEASSASKLTPWVYLGISRSSFYLKPKHERDRIIQGLLLARRDEVIGARP